MADALDQAQEIEEKNRALALQKATQNREQANLVNGVTLCLDCDVEVPEERVKAVNAVRCIDCQTLHEIKLKQGG